MTTCANCSCDCHCNEELHTPSDPLDTGGLCTCDKCECSEAEQE